METSTLTSKGQLLIPKRLRFKYGIKSVGKVIFKETDKGVLIRPMNELHMTCVNAGEVYYMAHRKDGVDKAALVCKALQQFPIHIIDVDLAFTLKAASLKAKCRLSFADAFAAALVINKKATLITWNKEFESLIGEANFKMRYL